VISLFGTIGELIAPAVIWVITGFKGNKWAKVDLINRGYNLLRTVESSSPDAAIATVAKRNLV
jgi:hypothetical protein